MTISPIPRQQGWRPAPAWSNPGRFWLAWPAASGNRGEDDLTREDCLGLAELLSDFAPVSLVCSSRDVAEVALRTTSNVAGLVAEHDGSPLGGHMPLWLVDGDGRPVAAVPFTALGRQMAERSGLLVLDPPPDLPARLDCDGEGTVLATVAPERRLAAQAALGQWLGAECAVMLDPVGEGAEPSPAARFLAPGLVVLPPHPANHQTLEAVTDACGRRLTLVELPNAKRGEGCYADCLVAGQAVVVPDFEDGRGTEAFTRIAAIAQDRRVSAFPTGRLIRGWAGLGAVVAVQPPES